VTAPYNPIIYVASSSFGKTPKAQAFLEESYVQRGYDDPADVKVIIAGTEDLYSPERLDEFPNLVGICRMGVGYDNIPLDYCRNRGIACTYTPHACTRDVAELAMMMLLDWYRGYSCRVHCGVYPGTWDRRVQPMTVLKVGIVGIGRIGTAFSDLVQRLSFTSEFYYYDPYVPLPQARTRTPASRVDSLEELAETCDVLSFHVPLTHKTRGMIGPSLLAHMKSPSLIINTARGGLFDLDLFKASNHRLLHGVSIFSDVMPKEPPPVCGTDTDRRMLAAITRTPHMGALTRLARINMEGQAMYVAGMLFEDDDPDLSYYPIPQEPWHKDL
jgi:phosphoglycerate dehydrogenase-like enzyme